MGMQYYYTVMLGYDITHLSGYIKELEASNEEWIDGITEYSHNYDKNKIGYEHWTRSMFGVQMFCCGDDFEEEDDYDFLSFDCSDIEKYREEIWARYKMFLFDHTKISDKDKDEPELVIKFIRYLA